MEDIDEAPECDNPRSSEDTDTNTFRVDHISEENERETISNQDFMLAATYIEDARVGRHSDFKSSGKELRFYHLYHHPLAELFLTGLIIMHVLLALFEDPAVPGLGLSWKVTIPIEFVILVCYSLRIIHLRSFTQATRFFSDTKSILLMVLTVLCLLDMIIYVGLASSGIKSVRWSRPLRPLFAINLPEMRQIRRSFRNMRRTLPDVFNVLVLLFFSLAIFALMAYKLFGGRNLFLVNGRPYFNTYWNSLFDLYVLITTANNPDIMMPAFDANSWYVIFFVVFLILCFFIYMNIILAVIYNNYRRHLKNEVKKSILSKRVQLSRAFDLVFTYHGRRKVLTKERFNELMASLPQRRSPSLVQVLWIVLDTDNANIISKTEFLKLADLLNVEVREVFDNNTFLGRKFPSIYDSRASIFVRKVVSNKFFRYYFDILTVFNAIVIGISTPDSDWDGAVEWLFLTLFMAEIMFKLYTFGGRKFFSRLWNVFDFFVITSAFFLGVIEQLAQGVKESRLSLDVLLVLRVLRLVKVIGSVKRFKIIMHTINKILPSLFNYGSVILVIYYIFAVVGMELFGGIVNYFGYEDDNFCGNVRLNGTDFWREKYCNNNFNDLIHALIVLFELTVVNQWQVIAYGYAAVTNPVARLYFMTFHIVCVTVVLNIFTAFVLEVFILEYSARQDYLESEVEMKIHEMGLSTKCEKQRRASTVSTQELVEPDLGSSDEDDKADSPDFTDSESGPYRRRRRESRRDSRRGSCSDRSKDTNVRFHISKKIRSVEVLLQKMFERELTDEIELNIDELNQWASEEGFETFGMRNVWSLP